MALEAMKLEKILCSFSRHRIEDKSFFFENMNILFMKNKNCFSTLLQVIL